MNRYQEIYNEQHEQKGSNHQKNRRSIFNHVRKERRTRMFDLFRGDIAAEPEDIKPVPKFTFRDTISKLIREKKKVIQKPRPFVVGTVKHKIHSPPFLHGGYKFKEPKRKLITPVQKSFAPSNYKFKIPKGLTMNLETPLVEENPVISPFALNTVWNKLDNRNTRRKEFMHNNITRREKQQTYLDSALNDAFNIANENTEQQNAKRELWPALDEEPVFGRLNMERMSRSLDNQSEDNEKETSDSSQVNISYSVLPNSSLNSDTEKELDKMNIQNLELKVDLNVEPNIASMSTELIQNPVANTSRMSNEHGSEMPTPSAETTQMDYRLSRISPPKTILSNTMFNFDNPETPIERDNTNLENINLSCSTPSMQNFLKDMQVQFENSRDASTPSTIQEDAVKKFLPGHKDVGIEAVTSTISPVKESPTINNGSRIESSPSIIESERTSLHIESSENRQKILNLTFTKTLGLIEEDEGDEEEEETVKLNLEYLNKEHKKKDNINTSAVVSNLHSSSVNKPNVEHEHLHETEYNAISVNNASKSKNTSSVVENENSKEMPLLSKSNLQDNCIDQKINPIQENAVSPQRSPEKLINEGITNTSPALVSNQINFDKDESLKNSSETSIQTFPKINIEHFGSKKLDDYQSQAQDSEQLIGTLNSTLSHTLTPIKDQPTKLNHAETVIESNNNDSCEPCNLSSINTACPKITENKNVSSVADVESDHSQTNESEQLIAALNSTSSNRQVLLEDQPAEINHAKPATESNNKDSEPCNLSSVSTSNRKITENKNGSDTDIESDRSQAKESEQLVAVSNSTSSNDQILFEDQPTEVNYAKPATESNNKDSEPCNSSSINTSNRRATEEKNISLGRIVYSCPIKLIDSIESIDQSITSDDSPEINMATSCQMEKEKDLTAKTQHSPDSTVTEKIISNESGKTDTLRETSPVYKMKIKITSPSELEKPVAIDAESSHADPVQSRDSVGNETIIVLTDSPISASRKSTKPELRKSDLDYKPSPLFLLNQKPKSLLSGSDENIVIDLISDEEDDYTSFLSSVLKKHKITSDSPKQSPRSRTPLASIGNISRLSASRTSKSPLVNKVNSPAKKTPVFIAETIPIVHVSPPAAPWEVLYDTPRKTPRRRKAVKEIATEAAEVPSPLRVMNLRNRNISVSPSPNKKTPRAITPCKTPVKCNVVKEVAAEATEDTSYLRVMNLRSRIVNVSPSLKKVTPRRKKNDNQCA